MIDEIKDEVKASANSAFGMTIAYLLPGLAAAYSIALWYPGLRERAAMVAPSSLSAAALVLLALNAVLLSIVLQALRWLAFESWAAQKAGLSPKIFAHLEGKLVLFRMAVDDYYRYHQSWGALALVAPVFFFGVLHYRSTSFRSSEGIATLGAWILVEVSLTMAARDAYRRYAMRTLSILGGVSDGQRKQEGKEEDRQEGHEKEEVGTHRERHRR